MPNTEQPKCKCGLVREKLGYHRCASLPVTEENILNDYVKNHPEIQKNADKYVKDHPVFTLPSTVTEEKKEGNDKDRIGHRKMPYWCCACEYDQAVYKSLLSSAIESLKKEKELHTHNSIPSYTDELDEGCVICVKNSALDVAIEKLEELKNK